MTRELETSRAGPSKGQGRRMVVLLHGYGADANDLLGLAGPLGSHLPDTVFLAPNAPARNSVNPLGYQWFPIPWIDGSSDEEAFADMERAADDLNAWLDRAIAQESIPAENVILFGFSQGAMMSLHVVPRRSDRIAGIVAISGRLLVPERLSAEAVSKPPVLLAHGDRDEVVPPQSMREARAALLATGFEVHAHVMKGFAHGIAPDGLGAALSFMQEKLGLTELAERSRP